MKKGSFLQLPILSIFMSKKDVKYDGWFGKKERKKLISNKSVLQAASRRAGVDSITKGKKFPEASRKSCGRNLKPGSKTRKGLKTSHENTAPLQKRKPEPKLSGHRQKLKVEAEVLEKRKNWDFFHLLPALIKFSQLVPARAIICGFKRNQSNVYY